MQHAILKMPLYAEKYAKYAIAYLHITSIPIYHFQFLLSLKPLSLKNLNSEQ